MKPRRLQSATISSRVTSVIGVKLNGGSHALPADGAHYPLASDADLRVPLHNGHVFEVIQSMSDDPVETCEVCGAPVERVFHPVAVHFKGSGFYSTDYGAKAKAGAGKDGDSASGDSELGSDSSGSESSSEEVRLEAARTRRRPAPAPTSRLDPGEQAGRCGGSPPISFLTASSHAPCGMKQAAARAGARLAVGAGAAEHVRLAVAAEDRRDRHLRAA